MKTLHRLLLIASAVALCLLFPSCQNMSPETQAALARIGERTVNAIVDSKLGPHAGHSGK